MDSQKAIDALLQHHKGAKKAYSRLLQWDETKTVRDNGKALRVQYPSMVQFSHQYKLKCIKGYRGAQKLGPLAAKPELLQELLDAGATYRAVGHLFGISRQRIEQIIRLNKQRAKIAKKDGKPGPRGAAIPGPLRKEILEKLQEEPKTTSEIVSLFPKEPSRRIYQTISNMNKAKQVANIAGRWAVVGA